MLKDIFYIGGFAACFNIVGMALLLLSSEITLTCDRWAEQCTITNTPWVGESEQTTIPLSDVKYVYVSSEQVHTNPDDRTSPVKTFYHPMLAVKERPAVRLSGGSSTDRKSFDQLEADFDAYLKQASLTDSNNGRFLYQDSASTYRYIGYILNGVGLLILVSGLCLTRRK